MFYKQWEVIFFQTETKLPKLKLYKMTISLRDFMKKYNSKDDTMNENEVEELNNQYIYILQRFYF